MTTLMILIGEKHSWAAVHCEQFLTQEVQHSSIRAHFSVFDSPVHTDADGEKTVNLKLHAGL